MAPFAQPGRNATRNSGSMRAKGDSPRCVGDRLRAPGRRGNRRSVPRGPAGRLPVAGSRALADRSPVGDPGNPPRGENQARPRSTSRRGGGRDGPGRSAHAAACRPHLGTPQQPGNLRRGLCRGRRAIPLRAGDHRRAAGARGRLPDISPLLTITGKIAVNSENRLGARFVNRWEVPGVLCVGKFQAPYVWNPALTESLPAQGGTMITSDWQSSAAVSRPLRPARLWYWVAGGLLAAAVICITLGVVGLFSLNRQIKEFQRVAVPGRSEVTFAQPGGYVLYLERPGGCCSVNVGGGTGTTAPFPS